MTVKNFDMRAYMDAWKEQDIDRVIDFYADDAVLIQSGFPDANGKDAIRESYAGLANAMGRLDYEIVKRIEEDDTVAGLIRASTEFKNDLEFPTGRVPAEGKSAEWEVAFFLTVNDDGKIVKDVTLVDMVKLLTQLGVSPDVLTQAT